MWIVVKVYSQVTDFSNAGDKDKFKCIFSGLTAHTDKIRFNDYERDTKYLRISVILVFIFIVCKKRKIFCVLYKLAILNLGLSVQS